MSKMQSMRKKLIARQCTINDLFQQNAEFISFADKVLQGKTVDSHEFEAFLRLCLDAYVYDENGRVLIPDRTYDMCMNVWKQHNEVIVFPDNILDETQWKFHEHTVPGVVGTLRKIYEYDELKTYINFMKDHYEVEDYLIAPKVDGVSNSIEVRDGSIYLGLTRYDGVYGQDVTKLIRQASNANQFWRAFTDKDYPLDGYYKVEVVVTTEHFNQLIQEKKYMNRRSATSGIISTPKNLEFGRFLTIVPLFYYSGGDKPYLIYNPPDTEKYHVYHPRDLFNYINEKLEYLRSKDYPFRVDGVVLFPLNTKRIEFNEADLMAESIAFKVNTAQAKTRLIDVYMSVGRLGNAVPMAKVEPVEVNETIVTDVCLGSYETFLGLDLYEGEEVIIYSAGDVIPQLKKTDYANNVYDKPLIKVKKVCPYCGEKLTRYVTEYRCENPNCIRVQSGYLCNFADKIGIEGFSDMAFEAFFEAGIIKEIPDIFKVTAEDIASVDGYDILSGRNFCKEVEKVLAKPIQISHLFGALGIPNISIKKCQKIFAIAPLKKILKARHPEDIVMYLMNATGIGRATALAFGEFFCENRKMIEELLHIFKIQEDIKMKGSISFTGFRSADWTKKFNEIGYDVSDSVTDKTVAVISGSSQFNSTKCKQAIKKGIPIYSYADIEDVYQNLR